MPRAHRNHGHPRDQVVAPDSCGTVKTCHVASDRHSRRSPIWLPRDTVAELDTARPLPGGGITARRLDRLNYDCSNAGGLRISIPRFEPQAAARDRAVIGMLAACWAQLTDQRTYALRQSLWNRHGSGSTASAQRSNPKPRATHLRHDHGAHLERYAVGHLRHSPSHLNAAPRPGVWTAHGTGYADLTRRVEAAGLLNRRHDIPGRHRLRLPPPLRRRPVRRGSRPTTGGIRRASSEWGTQCDVAGPMPTRHGLGMGNHREPLGNDRAPHVVVDVGVEA